MYREFLVGDASRIEDVLKENKKGRFNRILLMGTLLYLNDADLKSMMMQIGNICEEQARICIREPVGISERLTLKQFYSKDLEDNYNAIYRTRAELKSLFEETLLSEGFQIIEEDFLFSEESLNNRKETAQYYYILGR